MPSFLSKLTGLSKKKKKNPYSDANHTAVLNPASNTVEPSRSLPANLPPSASPRCSIDFLAEARVTAGRNPVTGHLVQQSQPTQPANQVDIYDNAHMQQVRDVTLYEQQLLAMKQEQGRASRAGGALEYYAPERHISEYYAGPVRD